MKERKIFKPQKQIRKVGKMKCPICKAELLEVGYPDELGYQKYACPNGCEFWRACELLGALIFAFFFVLTLPIALILRIFGRDKK